MMNVQTKFRIYVKWKPVPSLAHLAMRAAIRIRQRRRIAMLARPANTSIRRVRQCAQPALQARTAVYQVLGAGPARQTRGHPPQARLPAIAFVCQVTLTLQPLRCRALAPARVPI
jgi:hypothetical protein